MVENLNPAGVVEPGQRHAMLKSLADANALPRRGLRRGLEVRRRVLAELGDDLVFTCGIVGTNPRRHAITTIADKISLSLDVRSLDGRLSRDFLSYAESLGVDLGEVVGTQGAAIAAETWRRAARVCKDLEIAYEVMPSGAGHDAAVFQQAGVQTGMIFVRNENGSHNPNEAMDTGDFMLGCEVLWRAIMGGSQ